MLDDEVRDAGERRLGDVAGAVLAGVAGERQHEPVRGAGAEGDLALDRAQTPPSPFGKADLTASLTEPL